MTMRSLTLGATFLMLAALITLSTGGCGSGGSTPSSTLPILFVSDRDEPGNWDIYKLELESGTITRLTTDPAIDNHPSLSHDGTRVVFSTTRYVGNDFDLAIASDVNDIDGTAVRLTDDSLPGGPPRHYPDRHPHFSHDGALVLFSAKNRAVTVTTTEVQSECCVPIITHSLRYFENLCVIRPATGTHVILDPGDGLDPLGPNIWYVPDPAFDDDPVYIGHPSLSEDGTTILFNASVDSAGTVWNVYTVGFNPVTLTIVPDSLKRITMASGATPNPIKLNGGAHFSEDETEIIFSSTLTPAGNSMLFTIPSTA
ncbi:MAG: hypothetical protein GY946_31525, partial [bacterium]|nr:hypothetical protein [bacterium]